MISYDASGSVPSRVRALLGAREFYGHALLPVHRTFIEGKCGQAEVPVLLDGARRRLIAAN
jgi:hypothetical protein